MEKKENWKERLGGYDSMEEAMFVTIDEKTVYAINELKEFIQQELDRVREETRQEERDMFIVRYATVSFNEVIKTIKTLSIIEFLSIKWGLKGKKKSKLTTK